MGTLKIIRLYGGNSLQHELIFRDFLSYLNDPLDQKLKFLAP